MKGTLVSSIFTHRCEHILTNLKQIQGKLYPEEFPDRKSVSYSQYKYRAVHKNLSFELSPERFQEKCKESCYLCGKENSETHRNGIDRVDNTNGYTEENTRSCCSSCNYMKRDYDYHAFIEKLNRIYPYRTTIPSNIQEIQSVPGNKRSKEERRMLRMEEKKERQMKLVESYTKDRSARIDKIVSARS
jgi:hypothetical protein